jgi:hypothetical protein
MPTDETVANVGRAMNRASFNSTAPAPDVHETLVNWPPAIDARSTLAGHPHAEAYNKARA